MGRETGISWCRSTQNFWRGCTKVSEGCAHCYAERDSHRNPALFGEWGDDGTRVLASEKVWSDPFHWDRAAAASGEFWPVFTASIADVCEDWRGQLQNHKREPLWYEPGDPTWTPRLEQSPLSLLSIVPTRVPYTLDHARARAAKVILSTPHITWLFLTKRPQNFNRLWGPLFPAGLPDNLWVGATCENQERADERIPLLLQIPAALHWVSYEPALGPVDWAAALARRNLPNGVPLCVACGATLAWDRRRFHDPLPCPTEGCPGGMYVVKGGIRWLIVGGESGGAARPFKTQWAHDAIRQCRDLKWNCFVKQIGDAPVFNEAEVCGGYADRSYTRHGADPSEWPPPLNVQEFPPMPPRWEGRPTVRAAVHPARVC